MKTPFLSFSGMHVPIKKEIISTFEKFYDSNSFVLGDRVKDFEEAYSKLTGVAQTIGVSNGLDALHIALSVLGISSGDEVIVPSNTYIATVLAISYTGATPVFVEPNIDTYNIESKNIEKAITSRTKVILPVHLYGQSCEMEEIMAIANKYNLFVIEDNAQSHLSKYKDKCTGTWGHINATSFYPGKNLGALGDGGGITTNDEEFAEKARIYRNYGSEKKYYNKVIGYNMRLDELQASLLQVKLKYLEDWTKQRNEIASWYNHELAGIGDLILPKVAKHASHVYHLYVVRTNYRDKMQQFLDSAGIGSLIHYPIPPHLQEAYKHLGFKKGDFPIAEKIADTCLSLPIWPGMSKDNVIEVAITLKKFFTTVS